MSFCPEIRGNDAGISGRATRGETGRRVMNKTHSDIKLASSKLHEFINLSVRDKLREVRGNNVPKN